MFWDSWFNETELGSRVVSCPQIITLKAATRAAKDLVRTNSTKQPLAVSLRFEAEHQCKWQPFWRIGIRRPTTPWRLVVIKICPLLN